MTTQAVDKPKASLSIATCLESPRWREEIQKVIPPDLLMDALLRISRSAISLNRNLAQCEPQSFLLALLKCARAGLYPDGREAHLIPYKDQVQAIFDWKGIVALARRAGVDVTPKLVHEHDDFLVEEDDGNGRTKLEHRVNYKKPRGEIVAVWSRAAYPNGRVDYEVMTKDECEAVRQQFSRAKDSEMWTKAKGEAYKKTCIRRHSKRWDMSPEIREALNGDDDTPDFTPKLPVSEPKLPAREKEKAVDVTATVTTGSGVAEMVASIEKKASADRIGLGALMEFIKEICPIESNTLAEAAVEAEDTIRMIDEQWPDIAARIHGTK